MTVTISSIEDYEAATQRVRELGDFEEGTPEAAQLADLVKAIAEWDGSQDDATAPDD